MKCPICNNEMEEGGIVAEGISTMWVPMEQFNKTGLKRLIYSNGCMIGRRDILIGQTKISNAFLCENCNKVVGIFDITN